MWSFSKGVTTPKHTGLLWRPAKGVCVYTHTDCKEGNVKVNTHYVNIFFLYIFSKYPPYSTQTPPPPQGPHQKAGLKSGVEPCSVEYRELKTACAQACENWPWSSARPKCQPPTGSEGTTFLAQADEWSHLVWSSTLVNQPLRKGVRVGTRCFKTWLGPWANILPVIHDFKSYLVTWKKVCAWADWRIQLQGSTVVRAWPRPCKGPVATQSGTSLFLC